MFLKPVISNYLAIKIRSKVSVSGKINSYKENRLL